MANTKNIANATSKITHKWISGLLFSTMIAVLLSAAGPSSLTNAASPQTCPVIDGDVGDSDGTVDGTITINANTTWDTTGFSALGDYWNCSGKTIHVTNNSTLTFQGDRVNGWYPYLQASNVTIDSGSKISANGEGCTASANSTGQGANGSNVCASGNGGGEGASQTTTGAGGGANGGDGGAGTSRVAGTHKSFSKTPISFGSAGGSGNAGIGGAGGGVVRMLLTGTLTLNGNIEADGFSGGTNSTNRAGGGGSGGSVYLDIDTIAGANGQIQAQGGAGANNSTADGGGGGGGIVALHFNTDSYTNNFTPNKILVNGGSGPDSALDGEKGSAYYNEKDTNSEIYAHKYYIDDTAINNASGPITFDQMDISCEAGTSSITLSSSSGLTFGGALNCSDAALTDVDFIAGGGNFNLIDGSSINVPVQGVDLDFTIPANSTTNWNNVTISTGVRGDFVINDAATINLQGNTAINSNVNWTNLKGYSSTSNVVINANNLGCTDAYPGSASAGTADDGSGSCVRGQAGAGGGGSHAGGGGHGAAGAAGNNGAAGTAIGDANSPALYGSTGGNTNESGSIPGSGGGKVIIDVAGNFAHSGSISANGGSPTNALTNRSPGGGSGGSIKITATGTFSGSNGSFSAAGGDPNTGGTQDAGGGAGGRVYVLYGTNSSNYLSSLNSAGVAPGGGSGGRQGGTGTFVQTAPPTPPDAPVISAPTSGQTGVSVNPSLSTNAYAGTGDAHQDTDWIIVAYGDTCDDSYVAQNLSSTTDLVSSNVNDVNWTFATGSALRYNTQYTLCTRFTSNNNNTESNWATQNFTTENLADWSGNMTLRVTNPNSENLSNYQVRVQIDNTFFNFGDARSDGADIRFSDAGGGLAYPHYIADWDSVNQKGVAWVKVPSINGNNGTADLKMYFGNNSASVIPTTAGAATFVDFWDEDNFSDWTNGSNNSAFSTFEKDGDYLNIKDSANQTQDAEVSVNADTAALSALTLETRVNMTNVSGSNDNMVIMLNDAADYSTRAAQLWMPFYTSQGVYGLHESGSNKAVSGATFSFGEFKEVSIKADTSANRTDFLIKNTDGTAFTTIANRNEGKGNPDNVNSIRLATAGNSGHRSDVDFDFIAIRQYALSEPTMSPTGNAPSTPSISNPTGGSNQQFTNPGIQGSNYSGDFSLLNVDARIMSGDSCTSGTPVWEMTDSTLGNNFTVNSYFGSFGGTLSGKDALKFNTTYYACIRYANLIGDSSWSSPIAFTTEDLGGFQRSTTATISNSGSQLDNHQVRIVLNSSNFDFAAARSDGADLRFSSADQTQAYPHYLEVFDPSGQTAVVWLRVDTLPNAGDKSLMIHYSNNAKNLIPSNSGESVFLEFIDENDVSRFVNGHESFPAFASITSDSSAIRIQETDVSARGGAEVSVGGVVPTLDTYTIETRLRAADTDASSDHLFFGPADGSSSSRNNIVSLPYSDDQDAFANITAGASSWNKFGDGLFSFDTYYNVVTDMFETAGDTDIYIFNQDRTQVGAVDQNAPVYTGQTKTDRMQFYTRSSPVSAKTDTYIDYIAFRQYTANTITVSIVGGPSVSNLTAVEDANGSGNVAIGFTIDSIGDSDQVQAKIEYSIDGGSSWSDPTLLTDSSMVAASAGGKPTIDNAGTYQVGKSGGWIDTSGGAVTVTVRWDANTDTDEDGTDMQVRVTGYDNVSSFAGLVTATTDQTLDVVAPTVPANPDGTATSSSVAVTWDAVTETNFTNYEVWYGTDQTDVNNRNGTATEWDDDDDANLATISTATTNITGLDGETQYYFKICAIDDYGFEGCTNSFFKTTGAQPTVESVTAIQKADGTGHIDVSVTVDDADDDDTLRFTVQDNCGGDYANSTLLTSDASVTATYGDPGVSGNTIGTSGNWITTSSNTAETKNTVQFDLNGNNCTNLEDTYQVKITLNDGGGDITPIVTSMVVDQKDPTAPSNLAAGSGTASILPLSWTPGDDKNFNHYEIWYGSNQSHVTAETGTATEFDNDPDDAALAKKATNNTTLVSVSGNLYAKVCAVDNYNNKACTSTTSVTPNVSPVANQILTEHKSNTRTNVCTTVLDADQPGTMHLGADYSTNSGNSWTKMTVVSGTITATDGSTPGLSQGENHQIRNIDMSDGSNQVCFDWNTGNDISNNSSGLLVRFRPYDGTSEGVSGNGDGAVNSPPVARFAPTCTDLSCSFSSSNSSDPDGNIVSRAWSFGDGSTSTSSNPSKSYSTAGTYTVILTVTDNNGQSDSAEKQITVTASGSNAVQISNEPPEALFVPSCSGRVCSFSSSNSSDSDGTIASYLWNFGDGTSSTSANPSRTFTADGVYRVQLTVTDNDSDSDSSSQTISVFAASQAPDTSNDNEAPEAAFSKSCNGLTCSFNAGTSSDDDGTIDSYVWTFGNGTTATTATPSVTYAAAGTYNVRLEVVDNDGAYDLKFRNLTVGSSGSGSEGNQAPTASFTKSCTGLTCTFNASASSDADGSIANYYWSFGNGSIVTTQNASQVKTFPNSGTYRVTLVVEDDGGLKDMMRQEERVFNSDSGAGGGGGVTVMIDNQAPSGFGGVESTANTSSSIALEWDTVSEDNFNRYECWYGTDATKVANRDSSSPNGAVRWDESYDVNMMDRSRDNTTVNQNISEDTNYTFKCWAKDIYDNEVTFDAITQKSNDKPDILEASQSFTTDGAGKLNFTADIDDNDDVPVSLVYHYNNGSGWQEMSLEQATAATGSPDVSGNVVGSSSKVPTTGDSNTVAAVWATKTDLPNFEGTLQIRTYANDSIENGDQAILQDVIVDNLAPRGLAGLSGSFVSGAREGGKTKADNIRESKQRTSETPVLEAASASITLNWTPVDDEGNWSGIAAYWVEYGLAAETLDQTWDKTDDATLSTMTTSTTTISGLETGTTYYLKIYAQDQFGNQSTLDTISVTTTAEEVEEAPTPVVGGSSSSSGGGGVPLMGDQDEEEEIEEDDGSLPIPEHLQGNNDEEAEEETVEETISIGDTTEPEEDYEVETVVVNVGGEFRTELPRHWSAEYLEELLSDETVQELAAEDNDFVILLLRMLQRPDEEMNREEAVQLLVALADLEISDEDAKNLNDNFSDISPSNNLGALIEFSFEEGLISGYDDGTFRPENNVNRVEALKMIQTFYGLDDDAESHKYDSLPFSDTLRGAWYADTLMYAYDNGIVNGYDDGRFGPGDEVTYSQFLKMALITRGLEDVELAF